MDNIQLMRCCWDAGRCPSHSPEFIWQNEAVIVSPGVLRMKATVPRLSRLYLWQVPAMDDGLELMLQFLAQFHPPLIEE